ncbi:hypothetical protein [Natronomonas gomsonensis]|uniref:hypothetical protein n=1 Tax=Natronomonas gomsonensis TaxID=1046043 RepID=UPI0015BC19C5|nr:hypothetical protein [Natronomonas gomsonensis]
MTRPRKRLLAYAAALTFAVGVVGGIVASMTVFVPIDESASLIEARVGSALVKVLLLAATLLYVAAPFAIAEVRIRESGNRVYHIAAAVTGIVVTTPVVLVILLALESFIFGIVSPVLLLGVVAGITAVSVGIVLSYRFYTGSNETSPFVRLVALNLVLATVFVVGFLGVTPFGAVFADEYTEQRSGGGPNAEFVAEERSADGNTSVLTLTHDGGDPIFPENLGVRGEGFATVDGVDQTEPGPWQGSVSGERPRRGGAAVVSGDSIEIGVTGDCDVSLVYFGNEHAYTITYYDCTES